MFWRVSSLASGSAVEGILDKQQFTLEELLEEDELVQVHFACQLPATCHAVAVFLSCAWVSSSAAPHCVAVLGCFCCSIAWVHACCNTWSSETVFLTLSGSAFVGMQGS